MLPCSPDIVVRYLECRAQDLKVSSLKSHLTALKVWHKSQGFPDPTSHMAVKKTLAGISRIHGEPLKQAIPISLDDLQKIGVFLSCPDKLIHVRNSAIILIGFYAALRRSEICTLKYENLTFHKEGLELLIVGSKADKVNRGESVYVPYLRHMGGDVTLSKVGTISFCPVVQLQKWLELSKIESGCVFRGINPSGEMSKTRSTLAMASNVVKRCVRLIGLDNWNEYSGHSLRRGFATSAAKAGVDIKTAMKHGRWKDIKTFLQYVEIGTGFTDNAISKMQKLR